MRGLRHLPKCHLNGQELSKASTGKDSLGSAAELAVEVAAKSVDFFLKLGSGFFFCKLPDDDSAGAGGTSIEEEGLFVRLGSPLEISLLDVVSTISLTDPYDPRAD